MQWWCSAQGRPWDWSWRPYPGVWALLIVAAVAYGFLLRRRARRSDGDTLVLRSGRSGARPRRAASFATGLGTLWIALDWPVGTLGAGYLLSVHMVQFLLISLIAPPLILYGIPPECLKDLDRGPVSRRLLRTFTHPVFTLLLFNAVIVATHWPAVLDGLMASQAGSFALDMAWLGAGALFWWPLVCPVPHRPRFVYPLRIGYLILNTVLATAPFAFLTFSELPFYRTYELAPPVGGLTTQEDQRLAGILMKLGGGAILWVVIGVLFFRWFITEERASELETDRMGEPR